MNNALFLTFSLFLTTVIYQGYITFESHFSGHDLVQKKLEILELREKQSHLKQRVAEYQLRAFKQEVASIVPDIVDQKDFSESNYPVRTLSSVVRKVSDNIDAAIGETEFIQAKSAFNQNDYDKAASLLMRFIDRHSYSVHVVEAQFLLAEAQFQLGQLDESIETIESMVLVFPENDLTGLALLRFGKILESQDRTDEAQIIYKTVLQSFTQSITSI